MRRCHLRRRLPKPSIRVANLRRLGFVHVPDRWNPRPIRFVAKLLREGFDPAVLEAQSWFVMLADWDVL